MKLRRLNDAGIDRFNQFRASFDESGDPAELQILLQDAAYSGDAGVDIEVDARQFSSRFAVGEYLYGLFETVATPGLDTDRGMWTWLAVFYFEELCPQNLRLGEDARWVPAVGDSGNITVTFWQGLIRYIGRTVIIPSVHWRCWQIHPTPQARSRSNLRPVRSS